MISFNEHGAILRLPGDKYSDRIPWSNFSQADLKKLAATPKIAPLVEPFIEITQEDRLKKTEVDLKPVPRLNRPSPHSLPGAMFSSGVGVFVLLLLYAGNLYAAREVAIFRARPPLVVCGISAVAPLIGPIVFLSLPTQLSQDAAEESVASGSTPETPTYAMPNSDPLAPADPGPSGSLRLHADPGAAPGGVPQTQVFARGTYTFNRRFFETKFPGFFGAIRRDTDKGMLIHIKAARGHFAAQRITRITANDIHVEVHKGLASEEVMVPFSEIQEIQLKHKDA